MLDVLERHKDGWVTLAAMASPFVALAIGLFAAERQAMSTRALIAANVVTSFHEKHIDQLSEALVKHLSTIYRLQLTLKDRDRAEQLYQEEISQMAEISYFFSSWEDPQYQAYSTSRRAVLQRLRSDAMTDAEHAYRDAELNQAINGLIENGRAILNKYYIAVTAHF